MVTPSKIIRLICWCSCLLVHERPFAQTFDYPATPRHPVADTLFGTVVVDPYRWMEETTSQQMQKWLQDQARLTNTWLDKIPGRDALIEEYKRLDRITAHQLSLFIVREGGRYFYQKTRAGENVAKLYYRQGRQGQEVLLFDPQAYGSSPSRNVTFQFVPSRDGRKVALTLSEGTRTDIPSVRVLDVDTQKLDPDTLLAGSSVQAWSPDGKGFIYSQLQTTDPLSTRLFHDISLKYHRLGTDSRKDPVVLSRIHHPGLGIQAADLLLAQYSPDEKYLVVTLWSGSQNNNRMLFAPAARGQDGPIPWRTLVKPEDQVRDAIIYKNRVYLVSRKEAPNFKVLVAPLDGLNIDQARTLVPESHMPIGWIRLTKDYLLIQKTQGVQTSWERYDFSSGAIQPLKLPFTGVPWIYGLDATSNDCIVNVLSWNRPLTRYDYDARTGRTVVSAFNTTPNYPGTGDIVSQEVEVKGHDGTLIPLSLFYHKRIRKDGTNPVYMTGYGSYGSGVIQHFNLMLLPLLNKGVIVAVTHPRGGGEKGHAWHMGGFKATKPNTWKDFISCGEYLIAQGYTSAKHLIGEGTSAGGILIGRALTERPDLLAAAINNVPVSNPLRGENRPNGVLDSKEFGTVKDSTEAMGLLAMDAYLHVTAGVAYPAVLAVAGIHDTRVPVWQPAKLVAALQRASSSGKPVLLLVNYDSGHASEEKYVKYRNLANQFAFALWQAGHKDFQPTGESSR